MKKKFFLLLLMIFTLMTCGCGTDDNKEEEKKIIVGLDESFAPMGFRDETGEIVGFDVDLAKEAARRMNVKIEFRPINWANKKEELISENVDIIWNGCDITEERKEYMIFSKPYMDSRQVLLVRKGNDQGIHSEYDLENKIVVVQAGASIETYINENVRKNFAAFKVCDNLQEGFDYLSSGKYDAFIVDEIAGRYEMTKNPDRFEIIETNISPITEFGIGFRKEDVELRDKVQLVFDEMIRDGTAQEISERWFKADLIKSKVL